MEVRPHARFSERETCRANVLRFCIVGLYGCVPLTLLRIKSTARLEPPPPTALRAGCPNNLAMRRHRSCDASARARPVHVSTWATPLTIPNRRLTDRPTVAAQIFFLFARFLVLFSVFRFSLSDAAAYYGEPAKCAGAFYGGSGNAVAANVIFVLAVIAWTCATCFALFMGIKFTIGMRVDKEMEVSRSFFVRLFLFFLMGAFACLRVWRSLAVSLYWDWD